MTNSNRRLQETLTSSVEKVTGASMGRERVTEDCTKHGVSSCRDKIRNKRLRGVIHQDGFWQLCCLLLLLQSVQMPRHIIGVFLEGGRKGAWRSGLMISAASSEQHTMGGHAGCKTYCARKIGSNCNQATTGILTIFWLLFHPAVL